MPELTPLQQMVAGAKNPQEALLMIAGQLDVIDTKLDALLTKKGDDGWGAWDQITATTPDSDQALIADLYADMESREPTIIETDEETIFEFPTPSEEKMEARRQFEREHLKISEALGGQADPNVDYTEVYAKGGPMWLYHGNLELFKSYAWPVKQAMCQDVIDDSPTQGRLMALDALKLEGESGPGSVAMGSEADEIPQAQRIWNQ